MAAIQKINQKTVHRICSGQVVISLSVAVKELVENSMDSGATSVDVKMKNFGIDLIEVSDNGSGIGQKDYDTLALKHYTSKIASFEDVASVETYGFRGEALSSLCALSDLNVITCCQGDQAGTKLVYDHGGNLVSKSPCPRQVGTTVAVSNLFSTLPVRHKEFVKNIKKELQKMLNVLTAYALIADGVRISCTGLSEGGKKTVMLKSSGGSLKENLNCLFGPKQVSALLRIPDMEPSEESFEEFNVKRKFVSVDFKIDGFISSCAHGLGRSSTDRQFIFINKRPCDLRTVTRVANDVYHQYNRNQYPFLVLDIRTEKTNVDVNVTPDKRQIMIENENFLLAKIETSLRQLYKDIPSTFQVSPVDPNDRRSEPSRTPPVVRGAINRLASFTRKGVSLDESGPTDSSGSSVAFKRACSLSHMDVTQLKKQPRMDSYLLPSSSKKDTDKAYADNETTVKEGGKKQFEDLSSGEESKRLGDNSADCLGSSSENTGLSIVGINSEISECWPVPAVKDGRQVLNSGSVSRNWHDNESARTETASERETLGFVEPENCEFGPFLGKNEKSKSLISNNIPKIEGVAFADSDLQTPSLTKVPTRKNVRSMCSDDFESPAVQSHSVPEKRLKVTFLDEFDLPAKRPEKTLQVSLENIRDKCREKSEQNRSRNSERFYRNFRARIETLDNKLAEEELNRQISKDDFAKMELVGQFNLGFIITKLRDDLFIVDQHATDEIYNFEDLQANTVLQSQKLVIPKQLELTCSDESLLREHLEVFRKNGFEFVVDDAAPSSSRVKLTTIPYSRGTTFGSSDVEELIFMLQECRNPQRLRPTKVRAMLASRACRKSVMIGQSLTRGDMRRLVNHMGEMELPWNCPHGRPTMRHLVDLRMLDPN